MLTALALLSSTTAFAAGDSCLLAVDKDIDDAEPAIYVSCDSREGRLNIAKGVQITAPDGKDGTNTFSGEFSDGREVYRTRYALEDTDGTYTLTVGVGEAFDAKGNPRRRRGTCKFEDYTISKEPIRRSCSLQLEGNADSTQVTVTSRLNKAGDAVLKVALEGSTFTAEESAAVDFVLTNEDGETAAEGDVDFRRALASTTLAFGDVVDTYDADADGSIWDGWTYNVPADDGKSVLLSGKVDIDPYIVDGTLEGSIVINAAGAVELDVRGRADRDQDISAIQFNIDLGGDDGASTVFDAELEVVQRYGMAVSGSGDPANNSWTITSTGYDEDGEVVAGPFEVTVAGAEGEDGERTITGGRLRKEGATWRLGRGRKRTNWLEWDAAEMIFRTRLPAHKWTHVVVANGKSSLSVGAENSRVQRLRVNEDIAADATTEALVAAFSDDEFDGSVLVSVILFDSSGKAVSKGKPSETVVTPRDDGDGWDLLIPYAWPND